MKKVKEKTITYDYCNLCYCIAEYSKYHRYLINYNCGCNCPQKNRIQLTYKEYKLCKLLYCKD